MTFRVDAYPTRTFTGTVTQVRLDPVVVAERRHLRRDHLGCRIPALELKPGMTANVTIEVARQDDVLRVPSAALRFKPTESLLTSLGQDPKVLAQNRPVPAAASGKGAGTRGTVWMFDGAFHAVPVTTGVTDGVNTEVTSEALHEGTALATRVADAAAATKSPSSPSSPLMPQQGPPRRF